MLWCATKSLLSGIAILIVAFALGVASGWQALWALPVVFLIGLTFAGPALIMTALSRSYDFFNYYFVLVITPLLLVSGVFYPIDTLPPAMQTVVQLLPLTHAIELVRPLVTAGEVDHVLLHVGVLLAYAVISYHFAVLLVRRRLLV
jgi:lipooligosaccharide transport system permease protein